MKDKNIEKNNILELKKSDNFKILYNEIAIAPIKLDDIEMLRQWRNIEIENKCFKDSKYIKKEEQLVWFQKYLQKLDDIMLMISYNGEKIGTVAIYNIDLENRSAEFGRLLIADRKNRGKNIAFNASKVICKYFLEFTSIETIFLEVFEDNLPALNLYKKLGFIEYGEKQEGTQKLLLMSISK